MDKMSIVNQFNEFYINENKIRHIEDLSHDIPIDEIDTINKNQIIIGSTVINIPDNVLESAGNKNINIDAYMNSDKNIFYLNDSIKKYNKIGQDILLEKYKLNQNEIFVNFKFKLATE